MGSSSRFNFRQPRGNGVVGFRRDQWQGQLDEQRDVVAFGKAELEMLKFANDLMQQEETLRQQLRKEQSVASASKAVSQLDPADPGAIEKYAAVMIEHPDAQDSPFLRENFNRLASINKSYIESSLAKDMQRMQTEDKRALATEDDARKAEWQEGQYRESQKKRDFDEAQARYGTLEKAALLGLDATKYVPEDLSKKPDWAGVTVGLSEIKNALPKRPDDATMHRHSDLTGKIAGFRANTNFKETDPDFVTANAELNDIRRLYPLLAPPATPTPTPTPAPAVTGLPTIVDPGAAPAATPGPTPFPKPKPEGIQFLQQNPHLKDKFEQQFGPGSSASYLGQQ